jgi:hypothetical protein
MGSGFVGFLQRWYYWVGIAIALIASMFGVFYPAAAVMVIVIILAVAFVCMYHYYKYDLLKADKRPFKPPPQTKRVEQVDDAAYERIDIKRIAQEASKGPKTVRANLYEGSGMDLVERFVPLYEMLFPISFIADRMREEYQDGSLEVGEPICLWHTTPVSFSDNGTSGGMRWSYHCPKCPTQGKPIKKSLEGVVKDIAHISTTTLREGKMPMRDETLIEAIKRGRGELPG